MSRSRFPSKYARELVKWARRAGWEYIGRTSKGHLRLEHAATGRRYTIAATPSNSRAIIEAKTDLARLAGMTLDQINNHSK